MESKNQQETGNNASGEIIKTTVTETIKKPSNKSIDKQRKDNGQENTKDNNQDNGESRVLTPDEEFEALPEYLPHSQGYKASKQFMRAIAQSTDDEFLSPKPQEHYSFTSARVQRYRRI